jgi:hypothetical protein
MIRNSHFSKRLCGEIILQNLQFRPIGPHDIPTIQAMIQGNESCYLPFDCFRQPIFVATADHSIVGFSFGERCYDGNSDILKINSTYIGHVYDDEMHRHELHLAFINWAEKSLGIHLYKLGDFGNIQPINISHTMLPLDEKQSLRPFDKTPEFNPSLEYA